MFDRLLPFVLFPFLQASWLSKRFYHSREQPVESILLWSHRRTNHILFSSILARNVSFFSIFQLIRTFYLYVWSCCQNSWVQFKEKKSKTAYLVGFGNQNYERAYVSVREQSRIVYISVYKVCCVVQLLPRSNKDDIMRSEMQTTVNELHSIHFAVLIRPGYGKMHNFGSNAYQML